MTAPDKLEAALRVGITMRALQRQYEAMWEHGGFTIDEVLPMLKAVRGAEEAFERLAAIAMPEASVRAQMHAASLRPRET